MCAGAAAGELTRCGSISAPTLSPGSALSPSERFAVRHAAFHLCQGGDSERARLWFVQVRWPSGRVLQG